MSEENSTASDAEKMRDFMEERAKDRLFSVERAIRDLKSRVRFLGFGLLLALGLSVVIAFWPHLLGVADRFAEPGVLRVQHLVLEDGNGTARGEWRVDEEGNSRFTLLDRQGRTRLSLAVLSGGSPGMSLIDTRGQRRAALGLLPDGTTNLVFADEAGIARAVLGLGRADATHLVFADANGVSRVALGLDGNGVGSMMLPGEDPEETDPGGEEDNDD